MDGLYSMWAGFTCQMRFFIGAAIATQGRWQYFGWLHSLFNFTVPFKTMCHDTNRRRVVTRARWIIIIGALVVCIGVLALLVIKNIHHRQYLLAGVVLNADGKSAVIQLNDGRLGVCNLGTCDLQVASTGYADFWAMTEPLSRISNDGLILGSRNRGKRGRDIVILKGGGQKESMHLPPGPPVMCSLTTSLIAAVCDNGEQGSRLEFYSIEDGLTKIGDFRDDKREVFNICYMSTIAADKVLLHGRCSSKTNEKATRESFLYLVEAPSGRLIRRTRVAPEARYMLSLHLSNDMKFMTVSQPDIIELRHFPSLRLIKSRQFNGTVGYVAVSNGGEFVVFGSNQVQVWNTITNKISLLEAAVITPDSGDDATPWRTYDGYVMAMRFATSSSRVIIIRRNCDISEWEVSTAHKIGSTKINIVQKDNTPCAGSLDLDNPVPAQRPYTTDEQKRHYPMNRGKTEKERNANYARGNSWDIN